MNSNFYKLEIFVPESHFEQMQIALREVDAGHIGKYDSCLSYSKVRSTFRPLENANPYDGEEGKVSDVPEIKIEVTVKAEKLDITMEKIIEAHPYEEPVVNVIPLEKIALDYLKKEEIYHQLRFDEHFNIYAESVSREMTQKEKQRYDALVENATQLTLEDFFK